jgi:hypothetical protein
VANESGAVDGMITGREIEVFGEILPYYLLDHHKSHMTEPAARSRLELWHGLRLLL